MSCDLLEQLAAVVLLSGTVRPSKLSTSIKRPVLELPIDSQRSLLDHWRREVVELAQGLGRRDLPVRVLLDRDSPLPTEPEPNGYARFSIERDPYDYRGTGGVLRDMAAGYDDDACLLIANGSQLLIESLSEMVARLVAVGGDVGLVSHRDGTPSGLMLIRCRALRLISHTGFVDMKEQALPRIAQHHPVTVVHCDQPSGLPVRTLAEYISALRMHHHRLADRPAVHDPFAENLQSSFEIVQKDAQVDPTARVIDSVVLSGARVDSGAILVRSLVCPGAVVRRDQRIVDRVIVSPERARSARRGEN